MRSPSGRIHTVQPPLHRRNKKPLPKGHGCPFGRSYQPLAGWFNVGVNSITPGSVSPHAVDILHIGRLAGRLYGFSRNCIAVPRERGVIPIRV